MIVEWNGKRPRIGENVFIAPNAALIGDVTIGAGSSVWFGAVLRGDFGAIVVGSGANVQDNVVVHTSDTHPTIVGDNATIGHGAVLEACTVERGALVGMNAVVLEGAIVGEQAMIAAGAVVGEGMQIPPRHLAAGVPATVKKELSGRSLEWTSKAAPDYQGLARTYIEQGLGESLNATADAD
ncbi:MAG: isoleucine patch superfamily enzyme, carbonic anhydrase/acetyltransferase [Chloroflexi bacterium]|nr:isoleucine patch superfamily enzyme, carbonic anhydrase/acetyltransferase [Chloroflexota bacterium]